MGTNVQAVKGIYESFAKGDIGAVLGAFDEKIDWEEPDSLPYGNQTGPQAVGENIFARVVQDIQNFTVTPKDIVDGGDTVVGIGVYSGKGAKGDFEADFTHVWRFRDGKVTGFRTYTDTYIWMQALGKA
jgi:uncharacterized protein